MCSTWCAAPTGWQRHHFVAVELCCQVLHIQRLACWHVHGIARISAAGVEASVTTPDIHMCFGMS